MTRFMRVIHVFAACALKKDVDGPDEPGHDVLVWVLLPLHLLQQRLDRPDEAGEVRRCREAVIA
jgi:hypothetical protein